MRTRGGAPLTSSRLREGSGQKDKRSKGPKPPLTGRNWPLGEVCGSHNTQWGRRNAPRPPVARPARRNGTLPTGRERCVPGPARGLGGDWGSCATCRRTPNLRSARYRPLPAIPPNGNLACGHHHFESVWTGVRVPGTCRGIDHSGRLETAARFPRNLSPGCLQPLGGHRVNRRPGGARDTQQRDSPPPPESQEPILDLPAGTRINRRKRFLSTCMGDVTLSHEQCDGDLGRQISGNSHASPGNTVESRERTRDRATHEWRHTVTAGVQRDLGRRLPGVSRARAGGTIDSAGTGAGRGHAWVPSHCQTRSATAISVVEFPAIPKLGQGERSNRPGRALDEVMPG